MDRSAMSRGRDACQVWLWICHVLYESLLKARCGVTESWKFQEKCKVEGLQVGKQYFLAIMYPSLYIWLSYFSSQPYKIGISILEMRTLGLEKLNKVLTLEGKDLKF